MLRSAGDADITMAEFVDATVVELGAPTSSLATTTDLIYDFGMGPEELGSIAVIHALSDLYASLVTPAVATICMGVTREGLDNGSAATVLSHALQSLTDLDVARGGGHTVYSDQPFVGVTAVGINTVGPVIRLDGEVSYDLVMSKPLGSGIYLAALRNDLLSGDALAELRQVLHVSNREAAGSLAGLAVDQPGAIGFVTDVTGFGLLQAVQPRLRPNTRATLDSSKLPVLSSGRAILRDQGVVTRLGEENMLLVHDDPAFDIEAVDMESLAILSDPQTSGGLVAAVRDGAHLPPDWFTIGSIQPSRRDVASKLEVI